MARGDVTTAGVECRLPFGGVEFVTRTIVRANPGLNFLPDPGHAEESGGTQFAQCLGKFGYVGEQPYVAPGHVGQIHAQHPFSDVGKR